MRGIFYVRRTVDLMKTVKVNICHEALLCLNWCCASGVGIAAIRR